MRLISLIVVIPTLLVQAESSLSILGRADLTCPVCETSFEMIACTRSNTRGGVDRDLYARALGPQPEFYRIAACPQCGYVRPGLQVKTTGEE